MLLVLLTGCQGGPTAEQLRASTIAVSSSNATTPTGHRESWVELPPSGPGRSSQMDGYPSAGTGPAPVAFDARPGCRERVVAAIVDGRLGRIAQGPPRVGGGDITVEATGPGVALHVSRAAAPEADWPAIQAVAQAAFSCAATN